MDASSEKDRILGDYAAWLKLLMPDARAFLCYDGEGRLLWHEGARRQGFGADYDAALKRLLADPCDAPMIAVELGDACALLMPLVGGRGHSEGVMSVVLKRPPADTEALLETLRPALRTMQRELDLRYRLLENHRRLAAQATEEKLLHHAESLTHQRHGADAILRRILELCREYLAVDRAGILIEGRGIRLLDSDGSDGRDPGAVLDEMLQHSLAGQGPDGLVSIPLEGPATGHRDRLFLQGWSRSQFSGRRARRIARYLASHVMSALERETDALTGLPAWPVFEARLREGCQAGRYDDYLMLYLDVDQLHVINQNFGRQTGDQVLLAFSSLLQTWFGNHPVTRISSDSFAALLDGISVDEARHLADDICRRFREREFSVKGRHFRATVSVGIAPLTPGEHGASSSLAAAQVACRAAKERGGGRVEAYEPGDQSIIRRLDDIQLVGSVRDAIEADRLVLLGQPIIALNPGRSLRYFEVLVRMQDDKGRTMPPAEFLSAAERYQLMEELDRRVVRRSLRMLAEHRLIRANAGVRLAINLSGQSLGNEAFLTYVRDEIERAGVAPELLCFEITETVAVANMQRAQNFMHALRRMGCRFSLDDFGTGLSSFSYLKLFPVDTLKIDGSFVKDVATNVVSQSVVAALSEVARVMNLETVAEYVGDEAGLTLLRDLGVTWGQGYLFGTPARLEDLLAGNQSAAPDPELTRQTL